MTEAPLPPPYIPSRSETFTATSGTSVDRMDVDHVEVVDPQLAIDHDSFTNERIRNTDLTMDQHGPDEASPLDDTEEADEQLNKGTIMFSPFDWDRSRNNYNKRKWFAGQRKSPI